MKVTLIGETTNPEQIIATAAKLCYSGCSIDELLEKQTGESCGKFINMLTNIGHFSPTEHTSFVFAVEGVSRITEQQLTRHRIASYSIRSGRYVDNTNASFYVPDSIKDNKVALEVYTDVCNSAKTAYAALKNALLEEYCIEELGRRHITSAVPKKCLKELHPDEYKAYEKKAMENARMVFPNSLKTNIIFTMNTRVLDNFFKHRCCFRAQDEIRNLANDMLKILKEAHPSIFNKMGASCKKGYCPEGKMQCKEFSGKIPTLEALLLNWRSKNE